MRLEPHTSAVIYRTSLASRTSARPACLGSTRCPVEWSVPTAPSSSPSTPRPSGPVIAPYQPSGSGATAKAQRESVPPRVAKWKNALLDLSLRNKLINYTDRAGYRLEVPGPALGRFEDAVNDGTRITLMASDEVKEIDIARGIRYGRDLPERERELLLADKHSAYIDITAAAYKTKLRYLAYKARTIIEETGANNLYLTFGMLNWRFDDRELRSPLVLVPVTTEHRQSR